MAPLYNARTLQDIRVLAKQHGLDKIHVVQDLARADLESPASKWNIRHLIAYRLLVRPESKFLPVFDALHRDDCPVCHDDGQDARPRRQEVDGGRVKSLLDGAPKDLCQQTEGALLRLPEGFFWAALASAARREAVEPVRQHPQRERITMQRQGYLHSAVAIPGSSSPVLSSSSEFSNETGEVSEDEHEARRGKPEEITVHLVISFLQVALGLCLVQHPPGSAIKTEVRPRVGRLRSVVDISRHAVAAEDDGGIYRMRRGAAGKGWEMDHPYLAGIEAKRAFNRLDFDGRMTSYIPVISNENLAQYLGEAIIMYKANYDFLANGLPSSVFLIAATNTFIRFLHFTFGRDYLEYLDAEGVDEQKALAQEPEKDTYISMYSTKWLNLQSRDARQDALCHVMALVACYAESDDGSSYQGSEMDVGDDEPND
ncbi:hypothetical protein B0T24DRAFT_557611 [Lasiosphaeria ovina]|uniref:Uncharacterized protein n=1 Tax=Lasiosphaeria ovina TaxID=92902 RepID=A0AAE0N486_9PEZI|nr:hypothetical protein B0T24DRAFT_557611 [Lasiosphaeria ovina]